MELKKIIVAPNTLKGSLPCWEASVVMASVLHHHLPQAEVIQLPIADGGDDTLEVLVRNFEGTKTYHTVNDPLLRPVEAPIGWINDGRTAIIEMASASGIRLLKTEELDPMKTTTFGTGELIKEAVHRGAQNIWITLGGSATVDGGLGMLQAVGYRLLDDEGSTLGPSGASLVKLDRIAADSVLDLSNVNITALVDVNNPLLGKDGAAAVFGPQKGADKSTVRALEGGLKRLAQLIADEKGIEVAGMKHTGAAGGIAATLHAFLSARLTGGAVFILDALGMEKHLENADLLITAEGKIDHQSLHGKGPYEVAKLARSKGVKVAALGGIVPELDELSQATLFDVVLPITNGPCTLDHAMKNAKTNLERTLVQLINAIRL